MCAAQDIHSGQKQAVLSLQPALDFLSVLVFCTPVCQCKTTVRSSAWAAYQRLVPQSAQMCTAGQYVRLGFALAIRRNSTPRFTRTRRSGALRWPEEAKDTNKETLGPNKNSGAVRFG